MKALLTQIIKVIGGQAFLGIVGLMTIPFIARGFGVEKYGVFSLFILMLGVFFAPLFFLARAQRLCCSEISPKSEPARDWCLPVIKRHRLIHAYTGTH